MPSHQLHAASETSEFHHQLKYTHKNDKQRSIRQQLLLFLAFRELTLQIDKFSSFIKFKFKFLRIAYNPVRMIFVSHRCHHFSVVDAKWEKLYGNLRKLELNALVLLYVAIVRLDFDNKRILSAENRVFSMYNFVCLQSYIDKFVSLLEFVSLAR